MKEVLVVKCGSNVVADDGEVRPDTLKLIAGGIIFARECGYDVILVSSGAVACGKKLVSGFSDDVKSKQVAASYGQPLLMRYWRQAFAEFGMIKVGQCLETHDAFQNGTAAQAIKNILSDGGMPIINENDAVNTEELLTLEKGGDNDALAVIVAQKLGAPKLIFLTTVDGLFRPVNGGLELVPVLHKIDSEVLSWTDLLPAQRSTGMLSKVYAAQKASMVGIDVWIGNGLKAAIPQILFGEIICTRIVAEKFHPNEAITGKVEVGVEADYQHAFPDEELIRVGFACKDLRLIEATYDGHDAYTLVVGHIHYWKSIEDGADNLRRDIIRRVKSMFGEGFSVHIGKAIASDRYCGCRT
ncbi:hypothetical protein COU01_02410 [Candidatus Falkowbacteria bacterium CG10_big_fil_rev_8_21_14_0_10_44_15]|uniref:Aspartate/glutamate/uridylate kinase domain-containing protein n=1 Tax=Candidatus Falkowbacteria bacterium CG10_big_fil_rev_8_21_14_0_10_44_15 TaxID=1974569 RepID=A0A2H0UZP6_9BACT|nr:MAG: hypothetical protein COU01_02410 [Candidatus Falkowbacteria bacterium CG10_big_fil_rev_8_21_14_0_10_44_15]